MWFPLPVDEMLARAQTLAWQGRQCPAPAVEDLLLILCFHGAKHFWAFLCWLCDVAHLLGHALDWDVVLAQARRLSCERVLWLSLRLARDYLNAPLPQEIVRRLNADPAAPQLAEQCAGLWFTNQTLTKWESLRFHSQMRERQRDRARNLALFVLWKLTYNYW